MARWITVTALGPQPPQGGAELTFDDAIERMAAHWRRHLERAIPEAPDLIVIPEACDRFPAHSPEQRTAYYRHRGDTMRDVFAEFAREHGCCLTYSAARELPDGTWRNSTQVIDRQGTIAGIYNKNHVVIEETTRSNVLCGKDAPVIDLGFGTVGCAICFDLNFEAIRAKYVAGTPDLILFCSMYHGGLMQRYWAYSCRAHFVGAVAGDECTIINPLGEHVARSTNYFPYCSARINLDCAVVHLDYNRGKLDKLRSACGTGVSVTDTGHLGSVLITCNRDDCCVDDLVREFDIEYLDDYWERALTHQRTHVEP